MLNESKYHDMNVVTVQHVQIQVFVLHINVPHLFLIVLNQY
eukprot:UN03802